MGVVVVVFVTGYIKSLWLIEEKSTLVSAIVIDLFHSFSGFNGPLIFCKNNKKKLEPLRLHNSL